MVWAFVLYAGILGFGAVTLWLGMWITSGVDDL
jgi:hypothetical protein